jgi:hypothetical protein
VFPVVLLIVDGFQVPEMPLGEVVFNTGAVAPEHKLKVGAKSGIIEDEIETTVLAVVAHWPEVGVNTYVFPVVLLIVDGFQVPEMPLGEVAFNAGAVDPEHKLKVGAKSGVNEAETEKTTKSETVAPHAFVAVKVS